MAVEKVGEKYRCNVCGNEVTVTKVGGGELVYCQANFSVISEPQFGEHLGELAAVLSYRHQMGDHRGEDARILD